MAGSGGTGAPIALILAFVFPAIIAAALYLAYYGFEWAAKLSRPIEEMFRDISQNEASEILAGLEARVDAPARDLFERLAAEKKEPTLDSICEIAGGPAIQSYVVLGNTGTEQCGWPSPRSRKQEAEWKRLLGPPGRLRWKTVKVGSHHHYHEHETSGSGSLLVIYTAQKTGDDERYYVAARLRTDVILGWLKDALTKFPKNLQVTVVARDGAIVAGPPPGVATESAETDERFRHSVDFGKALYEWRLEVAPVHGDEVRAELERHRRMSPILIILSTTIIAVGLAVVWLVILAERRASRLKSDFIANVSHELKTPLSLIRMFGELVASGRHKGHTAAREYGAIITRESERLSHLIDNVLDFARLERGKASYDFAAGDLAEVLERALDVCRYRLDKEKVALRTYIEPGLPAVRMDENAMTLVILNLVDNAIKHAAEGRCVDVALQRAPGGVVLAVRDFGAGVPPQEQGRIFERFYRARSARDRNVRGSGIGLALVKYIAEAHGGRVTVESPVGGPAPGPGALFRVHLPAPVSEGAESAAVYQVDTGSMPNPVAGATPPLGAPNTDPVKS